MPDPDEQKKHADDWNDGRDREADEPDDANEPTYRDGSPRYECWHEE